MDVEPRVLVQPLLHGRVFVRGVVVDDQVQIQVLGGLALDLLEKPQPFHVRVPRLGAREDLAVQIVQRREQGDRAVADVIVRPGANVADAQRQARLRPLQGLALALLVAAQHQSFVWRIQIQANHIPELALELRVLAQLERAPQVRFEVVLPPDAVDAVVRDPDGLGHRPHAPTAAAFGRLRHLCDHLLNLLDRQPGLAPAPGLVPQALKSVASEPLGPQRDGRHAGGQLLGDIFLFEAFATQQHDAGTKTISLRGGGSPHTSLQFGAIFGS